MKASDFHQVGSLIASRTTLLERIDQAKAGRMVVVVGSTDNWTGTRITDPVLSEAIRDDVLVVLTRELGPIEQSLRSLGVVLD